VFAGYPLLGLAAGWGGVAALTGLALAAQHALAVTRRRRVATNR
jgi:hypothetical protein